MKKLLLCLLLLLSFSTNASSLYCQSLIDQQLNFNQVVVIKKAFVYGKDKDLSYSLAAIAWKESSAGKNRFNPNDPSAGVFQIHLDNAIAYNYREDTPSNRILVAAELIENFYISARYAVKNIEFWQRLHGDDWNKIWASYNAGYKYQLGYSYAEDIKKKISIIEKCNWS